VAVKIWVSVSSLVFFVRFLNLSLKTTGPYVRVARVYLGPGAVRVVRRSASRGRKARRRSQDARRGSGRKARDAVQGAGLDVDRRSQRREEKLVSPLEGSPSKMRRGSRDARRGAERRGETRGGADPPSEGLPSGGLVMRS
jgi:hypothetical protein